MFGLHAGRRVVTATFWQLLAPGEVTHVDADLRLTRQIAFPDPPKHQLRHEDLTAHRIVAARVGGVGDGLSAAWHTRLS